MRAAWLFLLLAGSALAMVVLSCTGCATIKTGLSFAELDYGAPTRHLSLDGIDVAYVEAGSGERTILLVHGLGSNLLVWRKTLPVLARGHRVVAIDLPGYGRSQKANYPYSMAFYARVLDRVIERLDLRHVTLVGHSMGGQIALSYALLHPGPGRVEALVLAAPAGFEEFDAGEGAWLAETVSKDFIKNTPPEALYANLALNFSGAVPADAMFLFVHRVQIVDGSDYDAYCYANARSVRAMLKGPVFRRLPEIEVPVLVVFGTDDKLIPNQALHGGTTREIAEAGAHRLPHARLTLLPRTGHLLQLENAEAWNREVLRFVDELPRKGR